MAAVNSSICLWSLAAVCSVVACGDCLDIDSPSVGETPESVTREWLSFGAIDLSEDNRIQCVKFVLQPDDFFGADGPVTFAFESDDRAFIELLTQAFQDVRVLCPLECSNAASSNLRLGHLVVKTAHGDVRVVIHERGFYLLTRDRDGSETSAKFESPSLATLIEAVLEREGKLKSSRFNYEWSSGQRYVDSHVAFFKKKRDETGGLGECRVVNEVGNVEPKSTDPGPGKALWPTVADFNRFDYHKPVETNWARLVMDANEARELSVVLDKKNILTQLAHAVRDMITSPPRATDKPCESRPIGHLVLTQPDGYVEIEIHPTVFRLVTAPNEFVGPSKVFAFQSPSLAYLIDGIRKAAGVPPFSDEQREALSGEAYIRTKRADMLDVISKAPPFRLKDAPRKRCAPTRGTKNIAMPGFDEK